MLKEKCTSQTARYYELVEQLASAMTVIGEKNIPLIERILEELSLMFRLCKGVTRLYRNMQEEGEGGGETLCSFNIGEGEPVLSLRLVTSIMSIATMTVYMKPGEPPLTDEERCRLEVVMRMVLGFASRNRVQSLLQTMAFYDDAGYRNLRSIQNRSRELYYDGRLGTMAYVRYNLRNFTMVYQELGWSGGNAVLRAHYDRMVKIVSEEGIVSRLSGDDFVALCKKERLNAVVDFLTAASIVYDEEAKTSVNVSANAGVYLVPEDYVFESYEAIRSRIIAPYMAAMRGKQGQIVFYDATLDRKREKVRRVQQGFQDALQKEEFYPVYQPKVNIRTGQVIGAEALCRWRHNGQIITPGDFIPALEETSDICRLDFYMLERVCRDIRRWLDEKRKVVRISANLSRKHLINPNLLADITGIIDACRVPRRYIEIEFTETSMESEFSDLEQIVSGMRKAGISAAIDDYGMGATSLNLVKNIPWNVLKMDRGLLPANDENPMGKNGILFRRIVDVVKVLGVECVAEGVETEEQLALLRETQCNIVQGFLFYKPLPVEEFEKLLASVRQ